MGDAYRLLGHRARSREELRRRLLAKEHDEHAVDEALERLAADGFLDDAAFARSYVADKRRLDVVGRGAHPPRPARAGRRRRRSTRPRCGEARGEEGATSSTAPSPCSAVGAPEPPLDAARRRAFNLAAPWLRPGCRVCGGPPLVERERVRPSLARPGRLPARHSPSRGPQVLVTASEKAISRMKTSWKRSSVASSRNRMRPRNSAIRARLRTSIRAICAPTPAAFPTKLMRS